LDLHPAAIEVLTKEEEREILCIAREALSNCVRHANATHAAISIRKRGDRIRVQISDDGQGFAMRDGRPRGYGLVNMTERAKKIGGTLQICSKESHGTEIIAEFSLEPVLASI
jgi:signal transduction histidine kinase